MTDAIVTHRLTRYYGARCVVNTLNLRVRQGEVYALLGRNGSGKSTTMKMLLGMIQPSFGHAELLGERVERLTPALKRRIAYVAEGHPLYRWMKVNDAVRFTQAFYHHWNQPLLDQVLDHFRMPREIRIRRLSNGQRAQLSLALAVAPDPDLLILDDPTLGLDAVVRRDFLESLIEIIQRQGRTILISSHILGDIERIADRVGILVDGVLRVDCPTERFKQSVRKVVLEFPADPPAPPQMRGLVSAWQIRNRLELVVVGYDFRQEQLLQQLGASSCEVLELNLEDAFIEYTRGHRRELPLLAREEASDVESSRPQGVA